MKLLRLSGTFGRLDGEELLFSDGLNILALPNEAGKSTWCALLRAMLYGMDSRERDKIGFLADKNRYAPWSGKPMAGVLELEFQGRRLRLRRATQKREPFALLAVEDMETDLPAPEFILPHIGELLTGVSREVFERTLFIPQGQMAVTASGDLEQRIAALISGGEEDVSFSAAMSRLKDWRNRRGRPATGLLPKLEAQRQTAAAALREQQSTLDELHRYQSALAPAADRIAALEQETLAHKHQAYAALAQRQIQAKAAWQQAERDAEALAQTPPQGGSIDPLFDSMSGEEAWAKTTADIEELRRLKQAQVEEKEQAAKYRLKRNLRQVVSALLGVAVTAVLYHFFGYWAVASLTCTLALVVFFSLWNKIPLAQDFDHQIGVILTRYDAANEQDMLYRATAYREELLTREHALAAHTQRLLAAQETARQLKQSYETLAAQDFSSSESAHTLPAPALSPEETARQLAHAQIEQRRLLDGYHAAKGRLSAADPDALAAQLEQLGTQIQMRSEELAAIKVAEEALTLADDALRQRFSPAINKKAGEIFAALTGGTYSALALAADFSGQVMQTDDLLPRQDLSLSAGTLDQLYLAVRLAICALTHDAPLPPLVLDDALASFDDARAALALNYLAKTGGQVLLFTCHSREAALRP
jgi:Uncharacterized conserved protein